MKAFLSSGNRRGKFVVQENIRRIALIGFGAAGGIIGADLAKVPGVRVSAFDIKLDNAADAPTMRKKITDVHVLGHRRVAGRVDRPHGSGRYRFCGALQVDRIRG